MKPSPLVPACSLAALLGLPLLLGLGCDDGATDADLPDRGSVDDAGAGADGAAGRDPRPGADASAAGDAGAGALPGADAAAPPGQNPYGAGLGDFEMPPPNPVTGATHTVEADRGDNGNDDRPAIQAAIDAAVRGDEVYLPDGVYNILSRTDDEGAIRLKSGVNLRGESEEGVVLVVDGDGTAEGIVSAYVGGSETVEDIVVSSLTIRHATGHFSYGIRLERRGDGALRRLYVDRVTVMNADRRAFRVFCASEVVVERSTATDNVSESDGYGFEAMCTGGDDDWSEHIVFRHDRALGPRMRHGFIIQDQVRHSVISDSTATQNFRGAIELHASGEHHIEIARNLVVDSERDAIKIRSGAGSFNWVHDNRIVGGARGIRVETSSNTVENNVFVEFDRTDRSLTGLIVSGVDDVHILGNVIEGNASGDEDYRFLGMQISGTSGVVLRGNVVRGNYSGVDASSGNTSFVAGDNEIVDNQQFDFLAP